jgi:hypothetical protein
MTNIQDTPISNSLDIQSHTGTHVLKNNTTNIQLSNSVINLSNRDISKFIPILDLGLGFVPCSNKFSKQIPLNEINRIYRILKIKLFFLSKNNPPRTKLKFLPKSNWNPPGNFPRIRKTIAKLKSMIYKFKFRQVTNKFQNFSNKNIALVKELKDIQDIVIKKADKGSNIVVMDKEAYINEGLRQLNDTKFYVRLNNPMFQETALEIESLLLTLKKKKFINEKQRCFLTPKNPRRRKFYLLPKIHKEISKWPSPFMPSGRPIISDCGSETYEVSGYIDHFLQPIAQNHFSFLKNSNDFVSLIKNSPIKDESIFVTADIESLYTNIDTAFGITKIKEAFDRNKDENRPDELILKLLHICLTKNDFTFDNKIFLQTQGTAMGKRFAPSYANIVLQEFDTKLNNYKLPITFYKRYIDDIFFVWNHTKSELDNFITFANSILPFIKLTFVTSIESVSFLDLTLFKANNTIQTKVFFKPTDSHLLLHFNSSHPRHTFRGIIKSQLIRFKRLCSKNTDFEQAANTLFTELKKRGYKRKFLDSVKYDITNTDNPAANKPNSDENKDLLPILLPYSQQYLTLGKDIRNMINTELTDLNINPFIAFTKGKSLANLLIRADLK